MENLDDYLAEQRAGELDSEGSFTLDPAKVRAKLQQFQLADPSHCLLKFVQAGVAWGASSIAFSINQEAIHVVFADSHDHGEIRRWLKCLASPLEVSAVGDQHLVTGINSALGLFPQICWGYSQGGLWHNLSVFPDTIKMREVEIVGSKAKPARLSLLGRHQLRGAVLRERCQFCPVEITVNGRSAWNSSEAGRGYLLEANYPPEDAALSVASPPLEETKRVPDGHDYLWLGQPEPRKLFRFRKEPRAWLYQHWENELPSQPRHEVGTRIRLLRSPGETSELTLVRDGVTLYELDIVLPFHAQVVAADARLKFDLGGFQVKEDEAYHELLSRLQQDVQALVLQLQHYRSHLPKISPIRLLQVSGAECPKGFGRYLLLERLHTGYDFARYRGVSNESGSLGNEVEITIHDGRDPESAARFLRETGLMDLAAGPGVTKLLDHGHHSEGPFRVEPRRAEPSLEQLVPKGGMNLELALSHLAELAATLIRLHGLGLGAGRMLWPENILFQTGAPVLANVPGPRGHDRNIAIVQTAPQVTPWLSPEEITSSSWVVESADQYILALIGYFMLTGQKLFEAQSPMETIMRHLQEEPTDPREIRPEIPDRVALALLKALAKVADDRFDSVEEFAKEV